MSLTVQREPIDTSSLPPQVAKALGPDAPEQIQMMAAQGMLPVTPEQNVQILYQLANFSSGNAQSMATMSFADLPANILLPTLTSFQHAGLLDWIASERSSDDKVLEAVIMNNATPNETVARLAKRVSANMCDVIATNQIRLLKAPIIIEQLYQNANARMATVDRLIELAIRENVELKGLPGLRDAMKSKEEIFDGMGGEEFDALLRQQQTIADEQDLTHDEKSEKEKTLREILDEGKSLHQIIGKLNMSQKIRLATIGTREAINILARDPNKLIHTAAVKSPRVKYPDIERWAKEKSMPDGVINWIAQNKDWTRHYDVKHNLCQNPKAPLAEVLRFLNHLRTNDLRSLSMNRNVPTQVSRQAKALYAKRAQRGQK